MHIFKGQISKGIGRHVELYVPGRDELENCHPDWPRKLQPGSLNVRISPDGYPDIFNEAGHRLTVKSLDNRIIKCAFEIPHISFGNNLLLPTKQKPTRGTAQVWSVLLEANGHSVPCWVLRRIGSGLGDVLEVVSHLYLRATFDFENGHNAELTFQD